MTGDISQLYAQVKESNYVNNLIENAVFLVILEGTVQPRANLPVVISLLTVQSSTVS